MITTLKIATAWQWIGLSSVFIFNNENGVTSTLLPGDELLPRSKLVWSKLGAPGKTQCFRAWPQLCSERMASPISDRKSWEDATDYQYRFSNASNVLGLWHADRPCESSEWKFPTSGFPIQILYERIYFRLIRVMCWKKWATPFGPRPTSVYWWESPMMQKLGIFVELPIGGEDGAGERILNF